MSQVRVLLQPGKQQPFWNEAQGKAGAVKPRLVGLGLGREMCWEGLAAPLGRLTFLGSRVTFWKVQLLVDEETREKGLWWDPS